MSTLSNTSLALGLILAGSLAAADATEGPCGEGKCGTASKF